MQINPVEPSASLLTAEMCELDHPGTVKEAHAEIIISGTWYSVMMCKEHLENLYEELKECKNTGMF